MTRSRRSRLLLFAALAVLFIAYAALREATRRPRPDTWETLSARGVRALNERRFEDAEMWFAQAEGLAGDAPSWQRGTGLQNMGKLRFEQHRFAEAESLFREALQVLTGRAQRPSQLALILNDLAICRASQGAPQEAAELLERAVRLDETADPTSPEAIRRLRNYAGMLLAAGRPADATAAALRATALARGEPVSPTSLPTSRQTSPSSR